MIRKSLNSSFVVISLIILFLPPNSTMAEVMGGSATSTLTLPTRLKVVLVEFADVKSDKYWDYTTSKWEYFTIRHTLGDFENLLCSLGTYSGDNDGDLMHGSFRDYFWEMSNETYAPDVEILNSEDSNGYPAWVTLPKNKSDYGTGSFVSDARSAATSQGLDVSTSTDIRVCYIYAGNLYAAIPPSPVVLGTAVVARKLCFRSCPTERY